MVRFRFLGLIILGVWAQTTNATPIPSSGEIIRSLPQAPLLQRPQTELRLEAESLDDLIPGGETLVVNQIAFEGNTIFSADELISVLNFTSGKEFDLAALRTMANDVSSFYRESGYSFAKVYVPRQDVSQGRVEFVVLEGIYGAIEATGEPDLVALVDDYLSELSTGSVINGNRLESVVLTLGDVPGIRVAPILKPGKRLGEGDLAVEVIRDDDVTGYFTIDNQGSRFSGENRASFGITTPTIFGVGHQLSLSTTRSNENLKVVSIGYGWPISSRGGRFNLDYSYVSYDLTNNLDLEEIEGSTQIYRGTFSHRLLRAQTTNVSLEYGVQLRKAYAINGAQVSSDGLFRTFPLRLNFNSRDSFWGGGLWQGSLIYVKGDIDDYQNEIFESWDKLALDITRTQSLGNLFSAKWRLAGQGAEKAINDSSEQMSLGGIQGVRAYPSGEGSFTRAYVTQLEVQLNRDGFAPYLFVDHGNGFVHGTAETTAREIGGYGLGFKAAAGVWSVDGYFARKRNSEVSMADADHDNPIFQVSVQMQF